MTASYSLRQVVELTGISEFTLRGWESRYGAFSPDRTSTGRRRYSAADLQRAVLLRELVKRKFRIGDVATLSPRRLSALLEGPKDEEHSEIPEKFSTEIAEVFRCAAIQDWDGLEKVFGNVTERRDAPGVVTEFFIPCAQSLGKRVAEGLITIAQEHVISSSIREKLFHLASSRRRKCTGRGRFVIAAPEGDFHELGILIAHAAIVVHGHHSLYLGPNSPAQDIAETALRFGATHLVVGSTARRREGVRVDIPALTHFLQGHLKTVEIWLGGPGAASLGAPLATRTRKFETLLELQDAIIQLNE